ncbi:hypothetical protein [Paenibacillus lutimineralis]|uniref:Uncharacterized protein n=1 Tax=Paenibacillus lutimineralis TaxID=2707005 RepID=A0A3Q9IC78_9BACL|nr:hypothetical protein [Paenibacillus lutimineralis]AZS15903.1 hypothetical protein EI981_16640 [Paenibacillus lutimineralis]
MCTGVSLYDTLHIHPLDALQAGKSYFDAIGMPITGATYYEHIKDGDHEGDHDLFEVSLEELKARIENGLTSSYWLYSDVRGGRPWDAAFTYQTGEYGSFPHIGAHCDSKLEEIYGAITEWTNSAAQRFDVPYGIVYTVDRITKAMYYAAGENGATMFPYENGFAFIHEAPGTYQGQGRYTESMLRMVYPYNLLSEKHMKIHIAGQGDGPTLRDWIEDDEERGSLRPLGSHFVWEIPVEHLTVVNQILGEAGILVAWRTQKPKQRVRKLP